MHWDLVRQWIGSLGPVVAIGTAAVPYWRNSKDRRREQAAHMYCGYSPKYEVFPQGNGLPTGQPEHDGVKAIPIVMDNGLIGSEMAVLAQRPDADLSATSLTLNRNAERVKLDLYSTSDEPFFNIAVWVTDRAGHDRLATSVGQLEPHGKLRHYVYFNLLTLPASPLHIRLEFQDAAGRSWQRIGTGPVKQRRRLTPTGTAGESPDRIAVPIQPKPDHYSSELRAWRSIPASEVPALLAGNTTTSDADSSAP